MPMGSEQDDIIEAPAGTEPEIEETEEVETEQETEPVLGGDEEGQEGEGDEQPEAADLETIEYEGEQFAVPKKLKDAFLRQSDYTRKTQEVADERRQVETAREIIVAQHKALEEDREDLGKLASIDSQIEHYRKYTSAQWDQFHEQNPIEAQKLWRHYQSLKESRGEVAAALEKRATERRENAARETANRVRQALSELQRDIKGFGPETVNALTEYGVSQGYSRDELQRVVDSRQIKTLHKAMLYDKLMAKQTGAPRIQPNPSAKVKPLTQVSKGASRPATSSAPSDKDSDEEWLKKRMAQIQKRA